MISIKKYLNRSHLCSDWDRRPDEKDLLSFAVAAYGASLAEMGSCSMDACPGLGKELRESLERLRENFLDAISLKVIEVTERRVREHLQDWGGRAATYHREKAAEVKDILIIMARTAESVGVRDERCAEQINEITTRFKTIVNLEDLTQMRASIEDSAAELKASIGRMVAEGKAAIDQLRVAVVSFQTKLEEAEQVAYCDSLTGLRSRLSVEDQIKSRTNAALPFCVAILDIDGFKKVNDDYGHVVGDELLQMFATELKSRCRSTDTVGRWGGDEFIVVLDCGLRVAKDQAARIGQWVCGNYTVHGKSASIRLRVDASIGLAEYFQGETMKALLSRADAEMYQRKAATQANDKTKNA